MQKCVIIPKEIIYEKEMDIKRVLVFSYLFSHRAFNDTILFTIGNMFKWARLKTKTLMSKVGKTYLELLDGISKMGYFNECPDFSSIPLSYSSISTVCCVTVNVDKFDNQKQFGGIYLSELQKILNFKEELKTSGIDFCRITSGHILLLLAYIRVNMNNKKNKPLCCFRFYKKISKDIGIPEVYIGRIVKILDLLKIIKSKEFIRCKYKTSDGKERYRTSIKIFADYNRYDKNGELISRYNCDEEIEKQIALLREEKVKKQKE